MNTIKFLSVCEGMYIWNRNVTRIMTLPRFLWNQVFFRLPFECIPVGTVFTFYTLKYSEIFIARQKGEMCGWSEDNLRENGWKIYSPALPFEPHSVMVTLRNKNRGDVSTTPTVTHLELWHRKTEPNIETILPKTVTEKTLAAFFVVEGILSSTVMTI